jgi:hypothetical protein
MPKRIGWILVVGSLTAATAAVPGTRTGPGSDPDVTVHEWGTFTSVAGPDGRAVQWLPFNGPSDLPCFVERAGNRVLKESPTDETAPLDFVTARQRMWGTVRMETPVLYFYSAQEKSLTVRVDFPRGLITEFYPHPSAVQTLMTAASLQRQDQKGFIAWNDVHVGPSLPTQYPQTSGESHYYAARATDATPLRVGDQSEKFLFYRGVAGFDVPVRTLALGDSAVQVNTVGVALPNVVLFTNRNGRIGYTVNGALSGETTIRTPALDGSLPELRKQLASMLVSSGLTEKESAAMVETWRDSWFEEGTRVLYVLPTKAVDAILPLSISPTPGHVARVFVGRMEVITPGIEATVKRALISRDQATLTRYGRFLSPITARIIDKGVDAATEDEIRRVSQAAYASYLGREKMCR